MAAKHSPGLRIQIAVEPMKHDCRVRPPFQRLHHRHCRGHASGRTRDDDGGLALPDEFGFDRHEPVAPLLRVELARLQLMSSPAFSHSPEKLEGKLLAAGRLRAVELIDAGQVGRLVVRLVDQRPDLSCDCGSADGGDIGKEALVRLRSCAAHLRGGFKGARTQMDLPLKLGEGGRNGERFLEKSNRRLCRLHPRSVNRKKIERVGIAQNADAGKKSGFIRRKPEKFELERLNGRLRRQVDGEAGQVVRLGRACVPDRAIEDGSRKCLQERRMRRAVQNGGAARERLRLRL